MLGLPPGITTCLFDLDGVLTDTAAVHARAWKEMFDQYLGQAGPKGQGGGGPEDRFRPFDARTDYGEYVDGKPRYDGVRTFLASRDIVLPEGTPDDPEQAQTVCGLGNRKNLLVQHLIHTQGVKEFPGSRRYLEAAERAGLRRVVVSSSANTAEVLKVTGLDRLIEGRIDGVVARERSLPGKPAPDTFLAGAALVGADPAEAAVFEDALAGVQAGRAGRFGAVIGVDRLGQAGALSSHGATRVVSDLSELLEE